MELANGAGAVTGAYTYDAFGAVRTHTGTSTEWTFTGEQNDPNGLGYLRARYYDPAIGRFLTQDPLLGSPLLPQALNRYPYVGNNPILWTDPSGLCKWNWDPVDKLDCLKDAGQWAVGQVMSPWNQAQFVQGVGYLLAFTCETGITCALSATFVEWSWQQKFQLVCNEISKGDLTVKEGSKKFLISLAPVPPGAFPGIGFLGGKLLGKAIGQAYLEPFSSCQR